jgi:hypothetical protein
LGCFETDTVMLQIFETVLGADGTLQKRDAIILEFYDRDAAARFIELHLEQSFPTGRCGYDVEDDYWWGCDDKPELRLYRYTIE